MLQYVVTFLNIKINSLNKLHKKFNMFLNNKYLFYETSRDLFHQNLKNIDILFHLTNL